MAAHSESGRWAAFPLGAFRKMGWAFLFLGISIGPTFRLGQDQFVLDLLPDFIGFLMIATAANRLVPFLREARAVRNLSLGLTFLAIPTILQYSVVTPQAVNISTWKSPLWPLMIVQGLLELVLVWKLCGLVAKLARRVGDINTEQRAISGRVVYVALKIALTIGLVSVLVILNPNLILAGVIAGVVLGLTLTIVMMQVMWRAERMCFERPEVDLPEANERSLGLFFRLLSIGGVLLPIGLAGGACLYYLDWKLAREEEDQKTSSVTYFTPRDEFYEHLRDGRLDNAYAATTADFKNRISREQLDDLARRYKDYQALHELGGRASGFRMSSGSESLTESGYIEIEKGKIVQVTVTIRRERDSIFLRSPPPVKVDDFAVEEKAMPQQGKAPRGW